MYIPYFSRFDEYATGKIPKGNVTVMRDVTDRKSVNKVQDILFDDVFLEYFKNKELLDVVESFIGPNIVGVHSMLIAKPPDAGSGSSRYEENILSVSINHFTK